MKSNNRGDQSSIKISCRVPPPEPLKNDKSSSHYAIVAAPAAISDMVEDDTEHALVLGGDRLIHSHHVIATDTHNHQLMTYVTKERTYIDKIALLKLKRSDTNAPLQSCEFECDTTVYLGGVLPSCSNQHKCALIQICNMRILM